MPESAVLASLGCGNPTALANLHAGETVLDLGSGGGIDVLLSAKRVGPTGKAYGLDMTDEMLALARANQAKAGAENVEFLKGEIERIPLPDHAVDVIISNCVINLSADKGRVLQEAFRVLRPGGRFAVSDVVCRGDIPDAVRKSVELWVGCIAGALEETQYRRCSRGAVSSTSRSSPRGSTRSRTRTRRWRDAPAQCRIARARGERTHHGSVHSRPEACVKRFRLLFLCTGNSARSQMAEAILNAKGQNRFEVASAGSRPAARVNPYALETLKEFKTPWAGHEPRSVDQLQHQQWDFVVTVCDRARESCPVFPGHPVLAHWGMPDPAEVQATTPPREGVPWTRSCS